MGFEINKINEALRQKLQDLISTANANQNEYIDDEEVSIFVEKLDEKLKSNDLTEDDYKLLCEGLGLEIKGSVKDTFGVDDDFNVDDLEATPQTPPKKEDVPVEEPAPAEEELNIDGMDDVQTPPKKEDVPAEEPAPAEEELNIDGMDDVQTPPKKEEVPVEEPAPAEEEISIDDMEEDVSVPDPHANQEGSSVGDVVVEIMKKTKLDYQTVLEIVERHAGEDKRLTALETVAAMDEIREKENAGKTEKPDQVEKPEEKKEPAKFTKRAKININKYDQDHGLVVFNSALNALRAEGKPVTADNVIEKMFDQGKDSISSNDEKYKEFKEMVKDFTDRMSQLEYDSKDDVKGLRKKLTAGKYYVEGSAEDKVLDALVKDAEQRQISKESEPIRDKFEEIVRRSGGELITGMNGEMQITGAQINYEVALKSVKKFLQEDGSWNSSYCQKAFREFKKSIKQGTIDTDKLVIGREIIEDAKEKHNAPEKRLDVKKEFKEREAKAISESMKNFDKDLEDADDATSVMVNYYSEHATEKDRIYRWRVHKKQKATGGDVVKVVGAHDKYYNNLPKLESISEKEMAEALKSRLPHKAGKSAKYSDRLSRLLLSTKYVQDRKDDKGNYNLTELAEHLKNKLVGADCIVNISPNDEGVSELHLIKKELAQDGYLGVSAKELSDKDVIKICKMLGFTIQKKDRTPEGVAGIIPIILGAAGGAAGGALAKMMYPDKVNADVNLKFNLSIKGATLDQAALDAATASLEQQIAQQFGEKAVVKLVNTNVGVKVLVDVPREIIMKPEFWKVLRTGLAGAGISAAAGLLASILMAAIFSNGYKDEKSCFNPSNYDTTDERFTDYDKYCAMVDRDYEDNPQKAAMIKSFAAMFIKEDGTWDHATFFNTLRVQIAGRGSKLNPDECVGGAMGIIDIEIPEEQPAEKHAGEAKETKVVPAQEAVYEDVTKEIPTIDARSSSWAKMTTFYNDCLGDMPLNKKIRILKIIQAITDGNYSLERLEELYNLSVKGSKYLKDVPGIDYGVYYNMLIATEMPRNLKIPEHVGDCDRPEIKPEDIKVTNMTQSTRDKYKPNKGATGITYTEHVEKSPAQPERRETTFYFQSDGRLQENSTETDHKTIKEEYLKNNPKAKITLYETLKQLIEGEAKLDAEAKAKKKK